MLLKTSSGTADRRLVLAKSIRGDDVDEDVLDIICFGLDPSLVDVSVMSLSEPSRFRKLELMELRSFMVGLLTVCVKIGWYVCLCVLLLLDGRLYGRFSR